MIDERVMGGDGTPRARRAWAHLAGRTVRMRSDLVVVALDIALAIAAGSLGFLAHNWHPAKIFMGVLVFFTARIKPVNAK